MQVAETAKPDLSHEPVKRQFYLKACDICVKLGEVKLTFRFIADWLICFSIVVVGTLPSISSAVERRCDPAIFAPFASTSPKNQIDRFSSRTPSETDVARAVLHVRDRAQKMTTETFVSSDFAVTFIGETHRDLDIGRMLVRKLPALKRAGLTHVGLEMFNSNRQASIDGFLAGTVSRADVMKILESEWGFSSEKYIEILEAVKENGLRVIALDRRAVGSDRYIPSAAERNVHMASTIAGVIQAQPDAKVLALVGRNHVERADSARSGVLLSTSLSDYGTRSRTYIADSLADRRSTMQQAVMRSGIDRSGLLVPVSRAERNVDGYIYPTPDRPTPDRPTPDRPTP